MARLHPPDDVASIASKPERDVARALLTSLDQDCVVFHSYPWLRPERNNAGHEKYLAEGEADFVIVSPDFGLIVLEVKGGQVEYDVANHRWIRILDRKREKEIQDPFRQAQKNLHVLVEQIKRRQFPGSDLPCAFGFAVILPDCEYAGHLPPGADSSVLLTFKDLGFLDKRIPELARRWDRSLNRQRLSKAQFDGVFKGLSPAFRLMPVLSRQVELQEESLIRLTERQQEALEGLYSNQRVLVQGTAGSGKTLLALARARQFARENVKTLFLCYNRWLAESLQSLVPVDIRPNLVVTNFHKLVSDYCRAAGVPYRVPDGAAGQDFWQNQAAALLDQAVDRRDLRFEAIVVDEAQDFFPNWWTPIELLNSRGDKGPLYVFCDPAQNLFMGEELVLPELTVRYSLPTNCRNTRQIAAVCSRIQGVPINVRENAPEGTAPSIELAALGNQQKSKCESYLRAWLGAGKLLPKQVAILSPRKWENSSLAGVDSAAGHAVVRELGAWHANQGVLFSTIRAFKGLEADAIIILDVEGFNAAFTKADFYVACSRAKHLLALCLTQAGIMSAT